MCNAITILFLLGKPFSLLLTNHHSRGTSEYKLLVLELSLSIAPNDSNQYSVMLSNH